MVKLKLHRNSIEGSVCQHSKYIFLGQLDEEVWPNPNPTHWSQARGSHHLYRDRCGIVLPREDTKLSAWNTWIWSKETQPHWRSKEMYDHPSTGLLSMAIVIKNMIITLFENGNNLCYILVVWKDTGWLGKVYYEHKWTWNDALYLLGKVYWSAVMPTTKCAC